MPTCEGCGETYDPSTSDSEFPENYCSWGCQFEHAQTLEN